MFKVQIDPISLNKRKMYAWTLFDHKDKMICFSSGFELPHEAENHVKAFIHNFNHPGVTITAIIGLEEAPKEPKPTLPKIPEKHELPVNVLPFKRRA